MNHLYVPQIINIIKFYHINFYLLLYLPTTKLDTAGCDKGKGNKILKHLLTCFHQEGEGESSLFLWNSFYLNPATQS